MTNPAEQAPSPQGEMTVEPLDLATIGREVEEFFHTKRDERRPYESEWYSNAAALNGKVQTRWNPWLGKIEVTKAPPHRRYININIIWGKFAAKVAKMVNSRPRPVVVAASQDHDDILNARFSQQALLYITRKGDWEEKYESAVAMSEVTGKAFLWVWWDPEASATFKDPQTGQPFDYPDGDVELTVGSAFELLVDDAGEMRIGKQKRIMRVSVELIEDVKQRWPQLAEMDLKSDVNEEDLFQFERQIADLGVKWPTTGGRGTFEKVKGDSRRHILKKEMFWAPTASHPKGRYAVVIAGHPVRYQEELPYEFSSFRKNPFPVEEISADLTPGRFWPQTMIERLRPAADMLDTVISKIMEDLDLSLHPKILIPRAARVPTAAFNSEGGEKVYFNYIPGMPPIQYLQPRGVSSDAWNMLDRARTYFDELSNIYPSSMGAGTDASSGFQTNLLQEAADAVYGPHKRRMERSWEGLLYKARRLMKQGYDVERLISISSKSQIPAVFEFHQSQVDEHADIQVQIGSALSDLKATRLQQALELAGSGLFGDVNNPQTKRAILGMVDLGGLEEEADPTYRDVQKARLENIRAKRGEPLQPPAPWETAAIHVELHFDLMNSPEWETLSPEAKVAMMQHVVLHLRTHNPMMGLEIAQMIGDPNLIMELQRVVMQQQGAPPPGAPAPPGPPGGPPPPGPPGPPPPGGGAPPPA